MATAGSIVLDLLMRTGSFETDSQRARKTFQREMQQMKAQASETASAITASFGKLVSGAVLGISAGSIFAKFVEETKNAQDEQAQLAAVLKSAGQAAGFSIKQLNDMASEFSSSSVFSEGDINRAQTRLLSYSNVVGDQFPRAMQATIDTAARMGMTVEQAAETVGRALDVPSKGMSSLSKQGFRFTEDQQKLAEKLEATGKIAEAQNVVLQALESSYGGAAKAARDALGGALQALQNRIDDLMTGEDGSVNGLVSSVNDLTDVLGAPETKKAFADFTSWLADLAKALVRVSTDFATGIAQAGGFVNALTTYGLINPFNTHAENAAKYRKELDSLLETQAKLDRGELGPQDMGGIDIASAIRVARARLEFSQRKADQQFDDMASSYSSYGETGGDGIPVLDPVPVKPGAIASKSKTDEGQQLIDQMKERLALLGRETEVEKLLAKVASGSVTFRTKAQEKQALGIAANLDGYNQEQEMLKQNEAKLKEVGQVLDKVYPERSRQREVADAQETLNFALQQGVITAEQFNEAMGKVPKVFGEQVSAMDEFSRSAAQNIQSQLGDGLYSALRGKFDGIGDAFADMLARMASNLASSELSRLLLGDYGKSGEVGGLFGNIFKIGLSGLFGGAGGGIGSATAADVAGAGDGLMFLDSGGWTGDGPNHEIAGFVHRKEFVLNAEATSRLPRSFLERLNKGYQAGGFVGSAGLPPELAESGGMHLQIDSHGVDFEVAQARERRMYLIARQTMEEESPRIMAREQANPNSRLSRQQARSTNMQRRR